MDGEILKTNPKDYAGFHTRLLSPAQISLRLCAGLGCGERAKSQLRVPGGYRPLCGRHAVLILLNSLALLGDPSPAREAAEYAEKLEEPWLSILSSEPKYPTLPENFACLRCGGTYIPETIGMYAGTRYIHNCGR